MKVPTKILATLIVVIFALGFLSLKQCSNFKKLTKITDECQTSNRELIDKYYKLVESKTRIDTVYKKGDTKYVPHTQFKTIRDTIYPDSPKVYGVYKDSINSPELSLQATITASELKAVDYTYSITQKIITQQSILTEHDTLIQQVRKGQLIGLADIGLHSYSAGLQYQSRKRLGFTARYNWYLSDGWVSVGVAYRIF